MKKILILLSLLVITMSCRVTKEPGQDKRVKNFEKIAKKLNSVHRK